MSHSDHGHDTAVAAEAFAAWALDETTSLPPSAASTVERLTLDAIGLMYAARNEDYIKTILDASLESGACFAVGHKARLTAQDSCLINGTAVHGEDFDDTFEGTPVHLEAPIIPAMIALGAVIDIDRDTWNRSITIASELVCRLALVAPMAIHRQGFHPTGVLGAFGAAAAAGMALRLSPKQLASALGTVGSMTSGIIEYLAEGTWTKRIHPGWAAASGLKAALLAKQDFVGPRTVFEGTHGFFKAFADPSIAQDMSLLMTWGNHWSMDKIAFKPFACGTMTQPFIDCAIAARQQIALDDIVSITGHVGEGTVHRLWEPLAEKQTPSTPYGAKFSVPYCISVGMVFGAAGLAEFTSAVLADAKVQSLSKKISYKINPDDPYPRDYIGWLDIKTRDGANHKFTQDCMRGGKNQPMSDGEIAEKFIANCRYGGLDETAAKAAQDNVLAFFASPDSLSRDLFETLPI